MLGHPGHHPAFGIALVAALWLSMGQARAAEDSPQVQAKRACAAGRVEQGVELLAALCAETGDINSVYNQGRCYQQNGRVDQALNRFREYLRRATSLSPSERSEVQGFIDELERQRERAALPAGPAPKESDEAARSGRLRTTALILAGVGVAAVATGVVLSLQVRSHQRDVERYVRETQPYADPLVVAGKMRTGGRIETFQWVAYGTGVAALAGSATCYLLGLRSGQERVAWTATPAPGGLTTSLRVRF